MIQLRQPVFSVAMLSLAAIAIGTTATSDAQAQNSVIWEPGASFIDTTNYTDLAPYYWFANFANASAVTGAPMNQNEVSNLPDWLHLETNPACKGFADDCTTADSTIRTGYSFTESGAGDGSSSIGGQPGFNTLTLPNGATGVSGQAVDTGSGTATTTSMLSIRVLEGAPEAFRMWVVLDNGTGANFQRQSRMRVNLRDTAGPPDFTGDSDQQEAEALPGGARLITTGSDPRADNGVADAWSFLLSGVDEHDIVVVRPTSAGGIPGSFGGFAGIMIAPIPEPASVLLLLLGAAGYACVSRRARR